MRCVQSRENIRFFPGIQTDSPEYRAACKLWDLYLRTKNEFVQRGEYEEDDEGYEAPENPGGSTEDEVMFGGSSEN